MSKRRFDAEEITFSTLTDAISKLLTMLPVLDVSTVCTTSNGMATIKPNAVVFIATEILALNPVLSLTRQRPTAVLSWPTESVSNKVIDRQVILQLKGL